MMEKIKSRWAVMLTETKKSATERAMEQFGLTSEVAFKQNWIYLGRVPEEHQEGLLDIFEEELEKQRNELNKLIG